MQGVFRGVRHKRYQVLFYIVFLWLAGGICFSAKAQNTQRPLILGISHVAFRVKDISKALYFYQQLLGYKVNRINEGNNPKDHFNFIVNGRQHLEVYSGLAAGEDERMLEIAFQINDAEAMRVYLSGKGVKVPESVNMGPDGTLSFLVEDPEKHRIKFIQYQNKHNNKSFKAKQPTLAVSDRILHVGITVSDVKITNAFYQDILGFSEIWRGGRPDNVINWINMRVPEGTDYVEYMLTTEPVNRQQLGVMHHVALQVPSIQTALDKLRKRVKASMPYTIEPPRVGRNNRWQLNLYDPDGTRVELMEPFTMK